MSISAKLTELNTIKQDIKQAIVDKGVDMAGIDFNGYAGKIGEIPTGGTSGGYTVTFTLYNIPIDDVNIKQTNGNDFMVSVLNAGSNTIIFENVTYIQCAVVSSPNSFTGITEAELVAGKTLTNDIEIAVYE